MALCSDGRWALPDSASVNIGAGVSYQDWLYALRRQWVECRRSLCQFAPVSDSRAAGSHSRDRIAPPIQNAYDCQDRATSDYRGRDGDRLDRRGGRLCNIACGREGLPGAAEDRFPRTRARSRALSSNPQVDDRPGLSHCGTGAARERGVPGSIEKGDGAKDEPELQTTP